MNHNSLYINALYGFDMEEESIWQKWPQYAFLSRSKHQSTSCLKQQEQQHAHIKIHNGRISMVAI